MAKVEKAKGIEPTAWLAFAFGLLALWESGTHGFVTYSNPPRYDIWWNFLWFASLSVVSLALLAVYRRKSAATRLVAGLAISLGLLASWGPTMSFFGNYESYPWLVVGLLALLSIGGGFYVGLKVLPLLSAVFLGTWFYAAFLPPAHPLPIVLKQNGLECRLTEAERGYSLQLRDISGRDLSETVDCSNIDCEGRLGPYIGIKNLFASMEGDLTRPPGGPMETFYIRGAPPSWAKSFDLLVSVRRWPEKPDAELILRLDQFPKNKVEIQSGRFRLGVASVHWGQSDCAYPSYRCIRMDLSYSGFSYSGSNNTEFRIVDDLGHVVPALCSSVYGSEGGATKSVNVGPPDPKAKFLRIQLYGEEATAKRQTVFSFARVPASS